MQQKGPEAELNAEDLKGYKEKIPLIAKSRLFLEKDANSPNSLIFKGMTQRGYELDFDPQFEWGCSPTESLLLSVAGCMAIDVVSFLRKMKGEIASFSMDIQGERNPTPPQYYKKIDMKLNIEGSNITTKKIERAIALSHEKYCSVYHSLRKDIQVNVTYELKETK